MGRPKPNSGWNKRETPEEIAELRDMDLDDEDDLEEQLMKRRLSDRSCDHTSQVHMSTTAIGPIFTPYHDDKTVITAGLGHITIFVCLNCHKTVGASCDHEKTHWYDAKGKMIRDINARIYDGKVLRCDFCGMDVT